jgi:CubicO group peptidase (beta-lactamase class C family)
MAALHVPGVSIAVIHAGQTEWARGFGVTKFGGPAVTPETLFQAASISKPVTALAVLHLVQSGKLDLDTDVNRHLKTWKVPDNEFTAKTKVTLRELLTHTAGMTVHGFSGYASGAPVPTLVEVLNGEKPANSPAIRVDIEPGSTWRYQAGVPRVLFRAPPRGAQKPGNPGMRWWSPSPDGERFLFLVPENQEAAPLTVLLNWQAGLKK